MILKAELFGAIQKQKMIQTIEGWKEESCKCDWIKKQIELSCIHPLKYIKTGKNYLNKKIEAKGFKVRLNKEADRTLSHSPFTMETSSLFLWKTGQTQQTHPYTLW